VGSLPSVLGNGLYIGASLEGGNVWNSDQHITFSGLQYGSALFVGADTALGPIYLGTGFHSPATSLLSLHWLAV